MNILVSNHDKPPSVFNILIEVLYTADQLAPHSVFKAQMALMPVEILTGMYHGYCKNLQQSRTLYTCRIRQ